MPKQPRMTVSTLRMVRLWTAGSMALRRSMSTLVVSGVWLTLEALRSASVLDMIARVTLELTLTLRLLDELLSCVGRVNIESIGVQRLYL